MRTEIIHSGDPAWDERLRDASHDVYHTAGFHVCAEASGEGLARLAVVGDRDRGLAWPYLMRPVAEVPGLDGSDAADATSVYGYPGPIAWGCRPDDDFILQAWTALIDLWRQERVIAVFTRFHPLLRNDVVAAAFRTPGETSTPGAVVPLGTTVSIDCTLDDQAAWHDYHPQVRRAVERSRRDGFTTIHDDQWTDLAAFSDLYRGTMLHNNAASYYFFPDAHFLRLRAALPGHVHLLITRRAGVVAAAGILLEFDGIVQTYLSASDRAVRPSPKALFYDDARRWARTRGNRVLHLGGGRGSKEDSLLEFKGRFSSRRHPFHVGRWILDADAYRELTAARAAALGAGGVLDPEFFPAYRSPVVDPDVQTADEPDPNLSTRAQARRDHGPDGASG